MPTPESAGGRGTAAAVGAAGLAVYLATLSRNLALAHDSIYYIQDIERGQDLFHPHHLLYAGLARLWLDAWRALGVRADGAVVVGALAAVFGALTLALVCLFLVRRLGLSRGSAVAGAALVGSSFGFWFYSTAVEVYLPPLFFSLLGLHLLTAEELPARRVLAAGVVHGLAILFHEVSVLLVPAALVAVLYRRAGQRPAAAARAALYAAGLVPVVAAAYAVVAFGILRLGSLAAAARWVTEYAHHPEFWSPLGAATPLKAAVGAGRAVVGGHFLFALEPVRAAFARLFPDQWLFDETFLVRRLSPGIAALLTAAAAALVVATVAGAALRVRQRRAIWAAAPRPLAVLLAWLGVYTVFFFFWMPFNPEFWIAQVTAGWMLLAAAWGLPPRPEGGRGAWRMALPAALALGLFAVNLVGSILWTRDRGCDYYSVKASHLAALARPGDLVVIGRSWILEPYVHRSTAAEVFSLLPPEDAERAPGALGARLEAAVADGLAEGRAVVVSGEAVDLEPQVARALGPQAAEVGAVWGRYRDRWQAQGEGARRAYRIPPAGGVE